MPDAPLFTCANDPGVTYVESAYVETSFRQDSQTTVRHVQVAGDLEERFIKAMLGFTVYDSDEGALHRFPPEPHPRKYWLFARSVDFVRELGEPSFGGPNQSLQFGTVELAVTYEAVPGVRFLIDQMAPFGVDHEAWRFVHVMEQTDIENRIIPKNKLYFDDGLGDADKNPVPEPGVQIVPSSDLEIDWYQVPAVFDDLGIPQLPLVLQDRHANCQGHVNLLPFFGAPPLTMFCCAPKKELVTMADGNWAWNFKFKILRRGWSDYPGLDTADTQGPNWERLLKGDGSYHRVYRKATPFAGTDTSIYLKADLYDLFRLGNPVNTLVA